MQTTSQQQLYNLPCQTFYMTIASNPLLLSKGYQIVYNYLKLNQQNRENTLLYLLDDKVPVLTLVMRTYPVVYTTQSASISIEQKEKTKQYLILQILLKRIAIHFTKQTISNNLNAKILNNFLLFLIQFHHNQGFQGWVQYYQKLLEQLIKINSDLIGYILIQILKNSDDRVSCFSKHILNFIIKNQQKIKITQEESLEIIYYCIKTMAYLNGTDDQLLQEYFEPHQQAILSYIQTNITKSIKIMKFSLKILTVLVGDYEIQLQKEMIKKIQQSSKQLVIQYITSRVQVNKQQEFEEQEQQDDDSSHITMKVILYQLLQLFETLLSFQQLKLSNFQLYLSICLPCLLLSTNQFSRYKKNTQVYLTDIEDQAEKTLRNKVVSFLLELYEGQYPQKTKNKLKLSVLKYASILLKFNNCKVEDELSTYFGQLGLKVNLNTQFNVLFEQSLTFLLYHLTQQILTTQPKYLQSLKQNFITVLGTNLANADNLIKVSNLNLLNKLMKSMTTSFKVQYYQFLLNMLDNGSNQNIDRGFLLSICRGIAYVSNDVQISIVPTNNQANLNNKGIPIVIIQALKNIILDTQTLQQSSHLILQFLLTLLKKSNPQNQTKLVLQKVISSQIQLHILTNFIHDGMIADVVIDFIGQIATQEVIKYIYEQYLKGGAKQQNLSILISKWVKGSLVAVKQTDIYILLKVYKNSFVSRIIKQYLNLMLISQQRNPGLTASAQLINCLNNSIHPCWILPMISCKILKNPEDLFFNAISKITFQLTSQYQIQSQLLLPYYILLNDPNYGLSVLKTKSSDLYEKFFDKLIRYAALFQGPKLKVITSLVFLNICEIDKSKTEQVINLIMEYGRSGNVKNMEDEQWEDQDQNKDNEQNVIDRMFNMKMTNDQVEEEFQQIFGDATKNMELVNKKVQMLTKV